MKGTDKLLETMVLQKYTLYIDDNVCGECCMQNGIITALNFHIANNWRILYIKGNNYHLNMCKILTSKANKEWYNFMDQKMFDRKIKDEVKSCIDKLPTDTGIWRKIKELCEKAYEYSGENFNKFKEWVEKTEKETKTEVIYYDRTRNRESH